MGVTLELHAGSTVSAVKLSSLETLSNTELWPGDASDNDTQQVVKCTPDNNANMGETDKSEQKSDHKKKSRKTHKKDKSEDRVSKPNEICDISEIGRDTIISEKEQQQNNDTQAGFIGKSSSQSFTVGETEAATTTNESVDVTDGYVPQNGNDVPLHQQDVTEGSMSQDGNDVPLHQQDEVHMDNSIMSQCDVSVLHVDNGESTIAVEAKDSASSQCDVSVLHVDSGEPTTAVEAEISASSQCDVSVLHMDNDEPTTAVEAKNLFDLGDLSLLTQMSNSSGESLRRWLFDL